MQKTDFKDLEEVPEVVDSAASLLARNTTHLAALLQRYAYPGQDAQSLGPEESEEDGPFDGLSKVAQSAMKARMAEAIDDDPEDRG